MRPGSTLRVLTRRKKVSNLSLALASARKSGAVGGSSQARTKAAKLHKQGRYRMGPEGYRKYLHEVGARIRFDHKIKKVRIKD